LNGYETWSLTLREGNIFRLYENRMLRRIFGPKREEVAGSWRRLHNEELRNIYDSTNIIRAIMLMGMRVVEHVARMEKIRNAYKIFIRKPIGKSLVGRSRRS
jgi:hypothetical protein